MPKREAPTVTELQESIFAREGFRVSFERLGASKDALPPYDYPVMAPNGWHVSDWQRIRLAPYLLFFRKLTVYRGDDTPIARDMKLGNLRDSYYEAQYGSLSPDAAGAPAERPAATSNVVDIGSKRKNRP